MLMNEISVVVREHLETVLLHVLRVVKDGLDGGTIRLVTHVDSEPIVVVQVRVCVHEKLRNQLTEDGNVGAEELGDCRGEPVGTKHFVDAQKAASVGKLGIEIGSKLENAGLSVRDLGDGAQSNEDGHFVSEVALVLRESSEHLSGTLGVANIGDFLPLSLVLDHVDHGGQVVLAHLVPTEVPVLLLILVVIPRGVAETVSVATGVSEPDIVAGAGCHKGRSHICVVDDPAEGRV